MSHSHTNRPDTSELQAHKARWLEQIQTMQQLVDEDILPDAIGSQLSSIRKRIDDFQYTIPLVGKFSTGKTTLLNAWIDEPDLLASDLTPTTDTVTEVSYSPKNEEAIIHRKGSAAEHLNIDQFRALKERGIGSDIELIELHLDRPRLAQHPNLILVDTPGIASGLADHETLINKYVTNAPAFLLCVHATNLFGREERAFLSRQRSFDLTTVCVVTQRDLVAESELDEILDAVSQQADVPRKDVVAISAVTTPPDLDGFAMVLDRLDAQKLTWLGGVIGNELARVAQEAEEALQVRLRNDMTSADLESRKADIKRNREQFETRVREESEIIERSVPRWADSIAGNISQQLHHREASYLALLRQEQDPGETMVADVNTAYQLAFKRFVMSQLNAVARRLDIAFQTNGGTIQLSKPEVEIAGGSDDEQPGLLDFSMVDLLALVPTPANLPQKFAVIWKIARTVIPAIFRFWRSNSEKEDREARIRVEISRSIEELQRQMAGHIESQVSQASHDALRAIDQHAQKRFAAYDENLQKVEAEMKQSEQERAAVKQRLDQALTSLRALLQS